MKPRHVALLVGSLLLCSNVFAADAPAPDLVALGRQEFDIAQREFNLGRYEAALEHFEAAYRLSARPGLLYNIGYTYRQLFQRTRKLELLELSIERFRSYLAAVQETDAASKAGRERTQSELKLAETELANEQAARARGEETLAVGEAFLGKGRLDEAETQRERFLSATDNERTGVARAWILEGSIAVARGKREHAIEAFASAISLDRSRQLPPGSSDAAKSAFAAAQEQLGGTPPVGVLHTPPGALKVGKPIELSFTVGSDPQHLVSSLLLFYRAGDGAFSALPAQSVGKVTLPMTFSSALSPGTRVDYYGLVVDARSSVIEHMGSPVLPFSTVVERPRGPSLAKRPWFWAVLGVSAAVVATGIGLAVHYTQPPNYDVPVQVGSSALRFR